LLISSRSNIR